MQVGGTVQGAPTIPRRRRLNGLLAIAAIVVIAAVVALLMWVVPLAASGGGAADANAGFAGSAVIHDEAGNIHMHSAGAGATWVDLRDDEGNMHRVRVR